MKKKKKTKEPVPFPETIAKKIPNVGHKIHHLFFPDKENPTAIETTLIDIDEVVTYEEPTAKIEGHPEVLDTTWIRSKKVWGPLSMTPLSWEEAKKKVHNDILAARQYYTAQVEQARENLNKVMQHTAKAAETDNGRIEALQNFQTPFPEEDVKTPTSAQ